MRIAVNSTFHHSHQSDEFKMSYSLASQTLSPMVELCNLVGFDDVNLSGANISGYDQVIGHC